MWLPLLTLLLLTECVVPVFGLSLNNCGGSSDDKTAEVVRGETSSFTCTLDSAESTHTLQWTVKTGSADQTAGMCPPPSTGDSCTNKQLQPVFTPRKTESTRSVMTVDPTKANLLTDVESGTLVCKDLDNSQQDSCPMDYITRASGTCSVRVDTNRTPWEVKGDCTITQGNSSRDRYRCQWFSKKDENTEAAVTILNSMRSITLPTGSARCTVSVSWPGQDGRYTYRVKFLPGRQFFTAGTFQISRPSTPTITCMPSGHVTENSTLTCTCTTDNVGQPAGRLRLLRDSSDIIASGAPGGNRLELSQTLLRSDDGVQFRCRLDWSNISVTSTVYTASVGYPPSTSELTISPSSTGGPVTVSENTTVTFTCSATGGNPPSTMTLSDVTSTLRSGLSPLTFDLPAARCEHSGVYTCTGSNSYGRDVMETASLFVLCSPRSVSKIPALNFIDNQVETSFSVTAYPVPTLALSYLGRSEITTCRPRNLPDSITMKGSCEAVGGTVHTSTCTITVYSVTSEEAAGIYQVTVSNSQGKTNVMFEVKYRGVPETQGQIEHGDAASYYFSVAVGLGVVLALLVIAIVVVVVWLWRRHWNLPWVEKQHQSQGTMTSSPKDNIPNASAPGFSSEGEYSSLEMSDVGLRSIYSGPTGNSDTGTYHVSRTSAVYENTQR